MHKFNSTSASGTKTNISKMCRICCDRSSNNLISLLIEENRTIVKGLRACANITVSTEEKVLLSCYNINTPNFSNN